MLKNKKYDFIILLIISGIIMNAQEDTIIKIIKTDTSSRSNLLKSNYNIDPAVLLPIYPNKTINLTDLPQMVFIMPIIKNRNFYEVRYNYDATNSLGLYCGHMLSREKKMSQTLILSVGIILGEYKGASLQLNYQLVKNRLRIDFQNQYSVSFNKKDNFYFNWSSSDYRINKIIHLGVSSQINQQKGNNYWDIGYLLEFEMKRWTFALFHFKFYNLSSQYFYVGTQFKL